MVPEAIPMILEFVGTLLIGIAVFRVHSKVEMEHKIDKKVIRSIKRERNWTIAGMTLIIIAFMLQIGNI